MPPGIRAHPDPAGRSPSPIVVRRWLLAFAAAVVAFHGQAPAQVSSINLSRDLITLGIASSNMMPNQPAVDARPLWDAAMGYAMSRPAITAITADPGIYYFQTTSNNTHAAIAFATNKTIDLQGAELRFSDYRQFGVFITQATNTTFRNFSLDYAVLPFTQVTVTGVDAANRVIQYSPTPGWPSPQTFNGATPTPANWMAFRIFRHGKPAADLTLSPIQMPFQTDRFTVANPEFPWHTPQVLSRIMPGDTAVIVNRVNAGTAMICVLCDGVTFENVRIYSGGKALSLFRTRNSTIARVYAMPKPGTDRLISFTWGAMGLEQAQHNNTFLRSRVIRAMDDGLHPNALVWGTVTEVVSPTTLRVRKTASYYVFEQGAVEFLRLSDSAQLGAASIVGWSGSDPVEVTFDRVVSGIPVGAVMAPTNPLHRGGNTLIDRSAVMHVGFANGITLWGLLNSTVRGSYVYQSDHSGINVAHWLQPNIMWLTPPAANVSIVNNVIDGAITTINDTGYIHTRWAGIQAVAIAPGTQFGNNSFMTSAPLQGIAIRGNVVADSSRSGIFMQGVNGGAIESNLLVNPNNNPHPDGWGVDLVEPYRTMMETPIVTVTSSGIDESGNVITQAPRLLVTDQQYRQLAAYAPGSRVFLNGPGLGTAANPAVTMRDANGTIWPIPIAAAEGDRLEVMLPQPSADITGGASMAVVAGGTTTYGTLFIDTQDNIPALNGCVSFTTPRKLQFGPDGGTGRLLVVGPGCPYSASSSQSFVTMTAGAGSAPGSVSFTVGPNSGAARTSTIAVAGDVVAIEQAGWGSGRPAAPGAPVVTGSGQNVTFTWAAPAPTGGAPAGYALVARYTCAGPILVTLPVGSVNSFTTTAPNGTFCVSVQATNAAGTGPESPGTSFSVPMVPTPPGVPIDLVRSVTGTTVNFSWAAPATGGSVAQYLLLASATAGGNPIATLPVAGNVTSVQVTGVPPGTYFVRIIATNAGGSSPASNEVTVVVDGPQPPQPPIMNAPAVSAGGLVTLAWSQGGGGPPTAYTIIARFTTNGPVIASLPVSAGATSISVTAPPGTYFVSVAASNAVGTSAESNQVIVVVP